MKSKIFYRGNSNLKSHDVDLEYTPYQIEEIIKCRDSIDYFLSNYVKVVNLDRGLVLFEPYKYQKKIIKLYQNHNRLIVKCPRQSGKTLIISGICVHESIFNSHKTIAILANKEKTSREILSRIKLMFEHLPIWLKCGVLEWNKNNIIFDNGSEIFGSATSSSGIRGKSCSTIIIDEAAFISKSIFDEFFTSVYPTISSSKESKFIMISTPYGMNHFYKFFQEAESKINGFVPFSIEWSDVPGRDKKFKEQTIKEIGLERWKQEYEASFIFSVSTLVSGDKLKNIPIKKPIHEEYNGKFKIYEKPNPDHKYILIVDIGEGLGKDYSTIQVIDVSTDNYQQVAVYRDNEIKPFSYHIIVSQIGKFYNEGLVLVERNFNGQVADNLHYESEYENLYYETDFGIKTTKKNRTTGCTNLSFLLETDKLQLCDYETIQELSKFVFDGKTYKAQDYDDHDDLVMPLVLFSWLIMNKEESERWLEMDYVGKVNKEKEEEISHISFFHSDIDEEDIEEINNELFNW